MIRRSAPKPKLLGDRSASDLTAGRRCRTPAACCQAHHLRHWAHGGPTDVAKLLALSRSCHHALHEGVWTATLHPDNTVTFTVPFGQTLQRAPP